MDTTIIIPIYNGASTLEKIFESIEDQQNKFLIYEIILINDCSPDDSEKIINDYIKTSSYKIKYIKNNQSMGLAGSYNIGIKESKTKYFILMHQDILLEDKNSINIIVNELENSYCDVVAVFPKIFHPINVFKEYNFWQKCLFSRFINKKIENLTGKFDGFKKELMLQHGISFNSVNYRTAGEDADIKIQFQKNNLKIKKSGINIIHIHNKDKNFNLKDLINKEAQLSECYGVWVRKHGISNFFEFLLMSFRPILVILLFIPFVNLIDILIILTYSFLYTKNVYIYERKNPRIFLLPIINIYLLFVSTFYYFKGFIYGKQKL